MFHVHVPIHKIMWLLQWFVVNDFIDKYFSASASTSRCILYLFKQIGQEGNNPEVRNPSTVP